LILNSGQIYIFPDTMINLLLYESKVPPPDSKSRKQILEIHTSNMPLNGDVDLDFLAKQVFI
jgi:hypothetical protein